MFYSYDLLCKKKNGKFSIIWLAATKKKLTKCSYLKVNIVKICEDIGNTIMIPDVKQGGRVAGKQFSLYLSAMLMHGTCLVYRQQLAYFLNDLSEVWVHLIKVNFDEDKPRKAGIARLYDDDTEDEDSQMEAPKRKRMKKFTNPNAMQQILDADIQLIADQAMNDDFQPECNLLVEVNFPAPLFDEQPAGVFNDMDDGLLEKMIEGQDLIPDINVLMDELNLSVMPEIVVADLGKPAHPQESNIVPELIKVVEVLPVGHVLTTDETIEDVPVTSKTTDHGAETVPDAGPSKKKQCVAQIVDNKLEISVSDMRKEGCITKLINKKKRVQSWVNEITTYKATSISLEQLLNRLHNPMTPVFEADELRGSRFRADEYPAVEVTLNATRRSASPTDSSKSSRQFKDISNKAELLVPALGSPLTAKAVFTDQPDPQSQLNNVPELPAIPGAHIQEPGFQAALEVLNKDIAPLVGLSQQTPPKTDQHLQAAWDELQNIKRKVQNSFQQSQEANNSQSSQRCVDTEAVLAQLREMWPIAKRPVTFTDLCPHKTTSRKMAAKMFYSFLEMHKLEEVTLQQKSPHLMSEIEIHPPK